jgi:transcriptional regulator with XRE-family HTH domain
MNLKSFIYSKGLSQWDVAKRLGWTETRLSRFITGRQVPSEAEVIALSEVLGLSVSKLRQFMDSEAN